LGVGGINRTECSCVPSSVQNQWEFMKHQDVAEMASVEIFNALGQSVFQAKMRNDKQRDVSNLSSGMYFVKVSNGNQSTTKKIIKK